MKKKLVVSSDSFFMTGIIELLSSDTSCCNYEFYIKNSQKLNYIFDFIIFDIELKPYSSASNLTKDIFNCNIQNVFFLFLFRINDNKAISLKYKFNLKSIALFSISKTVIKSVISNIDNNDYQPVNKFTKMEVEVLKLMIKNSTPRIISVILGKNYKTICAQKRSAMVKMGIRSNANFIYSIKTINLFLR